MAIDQCNYSIGDVVNNKYRITKKLGEGSFGSVWKVSDSNNNVYALKILKLWEVSTDIRDKLIKRFDMEYETGRIDSPYLVHSLDHGLIKGNPYILMEFCPHGDLTQVSQNTDWNKVAHEVLYGLQALHRNGKVHRDLKPENVLIKENGVAALTDFGIAGDRQRRMTLNGRGMPTAKMGTFAFMPPEQVNPPSGDAIILPTTDIFSYGVLMFLLLTGELPFGPLTDNNDLARYVSNGRDGRWNKAALYGSPFYHAIEGCLVPDFKKRLQSVQDVIRLLPPYQGSETMINPTIAPAKKPEGWLLRVMQGEEYGKTYDISKMFADGRNWSEQRNVITIGRADNYVQNDISIKEVQSAYISRYHCTISVDGDNFRLHDGQAINPHYRHSLLPSDWNYWKRSTNGTYVNSTQVTERGFYLADGDIITIGDVKMRFEPYYTKTFDGRMPPYATTI